MKEYCRCRHAMVAAWCAICCEENKHERRPTVHHSKPVAREITPTIRWQIHKAAQQSRLRLAHSHARLHVPIPTPTASPRGGLTSPW